MQDDGDVINPLQWTRELPGEAVQRPQNGGTYLHSSSALMQKIYLQNVLEDQRLERNMRRDFYKSYLRREEQVEKQKRREKYSKVFTKDSAFWITRYNGAGDILSERKVLRCKILDAEWFRYQGSTEVQWRVILKEEYGGLIVFSPLYGEEDLHSTTKLKRTTLGSYDCADVKEEAALWNYIYKLIISILRNKSVIEIPAAPGWYQCEDGYHFYSATDIDVSLFNQFMRGFRVNKFDGLDAGDTVSEVINDLGRITDQRTAGMLFIGRFNAFLGRLTGESCFRTGMVIWGENAEEVARHYLRTMSNEVDTVNLDSDRINQIRDKVCTLQDTSLIILAQNPDNRSAQNRLKQLISWMQTALVEGEKVKVPFVFCFKNFSASVPLKDMVVINASEIAVNREHLSLEKVQYYVMDMIEKSGTYWVEEIKRQYRKNREAAMGQSMALMRTVGGILLKMLDIDRIGEELFEQFRELLYAGMEEIEVQLSKKTGRMTEIFRDQVKDLVEAGRIKIYGRDRAPVDDECDSIYFDHEYYYFTAEVLKNVCKLSGIDQKSALHIKQELRFLSMIKVYQATGYRQEEMNIDFRICNAYGQRKDLSGMAVLREFWDDIGGIALCERG